MKRLAWIAASCALAAPLIAGAEDRLAVRSVSHTPHAFDPSDTSGVAIRYRLTQPAVVAVHLYDGRDLRIRLLQPEGELPAGEHVVTWDGRDDSGDSVPPEAYRYVIEATGSGDQHMTWDASDITGGERLRPDPPEWDADAGVVRYSLAQASRVRVRVGLARQGPLIHALRDWVPRSAGEHEEAWDGWDQDGLIDYSEHPELKLQVEAVVLPQNAILVLPKPERSAWVDLSPESTVKREAQKLHTRQRVKLPPGEIQAHQSLEVSIFPPASLERAPDGALIVTGPVSIAVDVDESQRVQALNERLEVMLFIDGTFVFENEVGFLPFTWNWDPADTGEGKHFLTVNLGGYMGRLGVKTFKVDVRSSH